MSESHNRDETLDILCNEKLKLIQKKNCYRFSIDSFLLSNFITLKHGERLLDIGTGCGIIPVYLWHRGARNEMVGIEIQEVLFKCAEINKSKNNCEGVSFLYGDITDFVEKLRKPVFHVIVANPPFTKAGSGRTSPQASRFIARHESRLDLKRLVGISSDLLNKKGRFCVIYPSNRLGELIREASSQRLELKRIRFVHPRVREEANLFLAEFLKDGGSGVTVEKPLYIYDNDILTEEVEQYYR